MEQFDIFRQIRMRQEPNRAVKSPLPLVSWQHPFYGNFVRKSAGSIRR